MLRQMIRYRWRRAWVVSIVCAALVMGLALPRYVHIADLRIYAVVLPLLVVFRRFGTLAVVCLVLLAFALGCWRGTQYVNRIAMYDRLQKRQVALIGTATGDSVYGSHAQLAFAVKDVTYQGEALVGTVQVSGFGEPMVYSGDRVIVSGKLMRARGNDVARLSFARIHVVSRGGSPIDTVRRRFAAGLQSAVPEPLASFGMGLLVGQRNTLPTEVTRQLQAVGLTHIIAVSGYNLTIIMRAAKTVFGKRSKYQYMLASIALVTGFLLVAGSSPSIVRASVVCSLSLAAWYYGRELKPVPLLLLAAATTAWMNPLYAWNNVSWMLSFLAFFGVLVISPILVRRICPGRDPPLVLSIIVESLSAEAMTAPYILAIFGQISLVATLANLLVAAFIPLAMLLSLCAGVVGMVWPALAGFVAWPATMLMTYMLDVVTLLSRIPHAFVEGIGFSIVAMASGYASVALVCWVAWKKGHKNDTITDRNQLQE